MGNKLVALALILFSFVILIMLLLSDGNIANEQKNESVTKEAESVEAEPVLSVVDKTNDLVFEIKWSELVALSYKKYENEYVKEYVESLTFTKVNNLKGLTHEDMLAKVQAIINALNELIKEDNQSEYKHSYTNYETASTSILFSKFYRAIPFTKNYNNANIDEEATTNKDYGIVEFIFDAQDNLSECIIAEDILITNEQPYKINLAIYNKDDVLSYTYKYFKSISNTSKMAIVDMHLAYIKDKEEDRFLPCVEVILVDIKDDKLLTNQKKTIIHLDLRTGLVL